MTKNPAEELLGISGKAAIVTGAAGGIGNAVTKLLSSLEVNIVGVDLKFPPDWESNSKNSVTSLVGDVSKPECAEEAVRVCKQTYGGVHILVNNAGIMIGGSIFDLKMNNWSRTMEVNLQGYLNFAKAVVPEMVNSKMKGRIVNTSSIDGIFAEPGILAYSAAKAAIIILTKCLAIELARHQITVNSVAPGWVDTPMATSVLAKEQPMS